MAGLWLFYLVLFKITSTIACPTACSCFGYNGSWIADCSRRNLSSIPSGFSGNTTEIFLQYNNIEEIRSESFSSLYNLRFLHLHENIISTVDESAFRDASQSLQYLTLSRNQISNLTVEVFAGMSSLKVLNLNNNLLTSIKENLLQDLTKGVQVSASKNQINFIGENTLNNANSLRYVGFSHNNLSRIPSTLGESALDIYVFDFADNNLSELPHIPKTLRQIYLNGNHISRVTSQALTNATMLYEFFLQDNDVESIEKDAFANSHLIGWLDLSKNNLSKIEDDMFQNLAQLKSLNVTRNPRLASISRSSLKPFKKSLIRLSFDSCSLTNLDPNIINSLENDDLYVWAGKNPWDCNCDLQGFASLVREQSQMFYDISSMLCVHPQYLEGKRIDDVTQTEFSSACNGYNDPPINETALIISMSIIGSIALGAIIVFMILKAKKNRAVWFGSNDTILTEASLHQLEREESA